MPRTTLTTALVLSATVGLAAPAMATGPATAAGAGTGSAATADPGGRNWSPRETRAAVDRLKALTPRPSARLTELRKRLGVDPEQRDKALRRAVANQEPACEDTAFSRWVDGQLKDWSMADLDFLLVTGVLDFPALEALLYQPSRAQSFGIDGSYTFEVNRTAGRLRGFWDVNGNDIRVVAMHGSVLQDHARMVRLVRDIYGLDAVEAEKYVDTIDYFLAQPKMQKGEHPMFTLNAFAYSDRIYPPGERLGVPDKIVLGDGILQGLKAVGLNSVAARGVLAHEYGHQVQFRIGRYTPLPDFPEPEWTRERELEADGFAGYYGAHLKGENLQGQDVTSLVRTFEEVGDCFVDFPGHHGTPTQRKAAAQWGVDRAKEMRPRTAITSARVFSSQFRAALPQILAAG